MPFEVHSADCPRLCKFVWTGACHHHESHACTCPGASYVAVRKEELEELVEAAERSVTFCSRPHHYLDEKLQPFRRGEAKEQE